MTHDPKTEAGVSLLPCPFCGNQPHSHADNIQYNADDLPWNGQWIIECNACPVDSSTWGATKDKAIAHWNTRTAPVPQCEAEPWSMAEALSNEGAAKVNAALAALPSSSDAVTRDALIEQCAKIADPWPGFNVGQKIQDPDYSVIVVRTKIAAAIRALSLKPYVLSGAHQDSMMDQGATEAPQHRSGHPAVENDA